jgi:hypothetical protein
LLTKECWKFRTLRVGRIEDGGHACLRLISGADTCIAEVEQQLLISGVKRAKLTRKELYSYFQGS